MRVRIYNDAHLVEAQEWSTPPRGSRTPPGRPGASAPSSAHKPRGSPERELDQRWARNMMLNKWLEYCVERGHRFSSRPERRAGA